ncbi:hypothetical protein [Microbacterium sp. HMWF026]|uniref:hypothetical protein n=1 Tax=Microbacterium sp. HMWF026 TaxID=2056861 RepID=UPI0011B1E39D|nr:hypothetical protein [Microbacterium sp. HMWF026]
MSKKRCTATITVNNRGRQGQPCRAWAVSGSDFCNGHTEDGGIGPRDVTKIERRCIGRHGDGEQCRNAALRGQRTCRYHGANKASAAKAQDLLDRMVEPVLWELRRIALDAETSEGDRLQAMRMILDRTLPKERKVEVTHKPWEVTLQAIIRQAPEGEAIPGGTVVPRELMSENVIDAEVVNEGQDLHTPTLEEVEAQEREDRKRRITESGQPEWFKQDRLEQLRREYPDQGRPNLHSTVDSRNAR